MSSRWLTATLSQVGILPLSGRSGPEAPMTEASREKTCRCPSTIKRTSSKLLWGGLFFLGGVWVPPCEGLSLHLEQNNPWDVRWVGRFVPRFCRFCGPVGVQQDGRVLLCFGAPCGSRHDLSWVYCVLRTVGLVCRGRCLRGWGFVSDSHTVSPRCQWGCSLGIWAGPMFLMFYSPLLVLSALLWEQKLLAPTIGSHPVAPLSWR